MSSPVPDTGRDEKGRWKPGYSPGPGLGRKRRPYLYSIVSARAEAEGKDLEQELWRVTVALIELAKKGDVAAAKLLFERLTDSDPIAVELTNAAGPMPPNVEGMAAYIAKMESAARGMTGDATG